MYSCEEMKEDYNIIKEFCGKFRRELTIASGVVADFIGIASYDEYVKFVDGLNQDEFTGNYLSVLLVESGIDAYKEILDGNMSFDEFVKDILFNEDCISMCYEKLKEI